MKNEGDAIRKALNANPRARRVKAQPQAILLRGARQMNIGREATNQPTQEVKSDGGA